MTQQQPEPQPDDVPEFYRVLFPDPEAQQQAQQVNGHQQPNRPYATAALSKEVAALATAERGTRNHQLNVSAFKLAQLVAAGHLEQAPVWNLLHSTALSIGLTETETNATLHSAFNAGKMQPRLVSDLDTPLPPVTTVTPPDVHLAAATSTDDASDDDASATIRKRFPALDWRDLWADTEEDPWLLKPLIPARRLVALFSPPKVGKSLLMLELAVELSQGREVLGYQPTDAVKVLYVDFENDPRGDVRTRLQAMGKQPDDLGNLFYLSYPKLAYLDTPMGGLELLAVAQEYGVELVVIDTISRAVSGEENVNDTWLAFYRNTGQLLKAAGIAAVRLDHTGKDETKGMRGGSAKYGDVDVVWAMARLSEDRFQLECTANRLPVPEKYLTIKREAAPLRHVVDLAGRLTAHEQGVRRALVLIKAMDPPVPRKLPHDAQPPKGAGYRALWPVLKKLDSTLTWKHVKDAAAEYHGMRRADDAEQAGLNYTEEDE